ncbi:RnfH family protein [Fulvimonas sp. R45]|uniref:RnfH family protein n=1 Tax=Fulvimonas sp. R45 TaxID=3045937 RepID=UPI00265DC156|nr:RnfH family protein [Fulvimonas sp. R45]MDO1527327.1 RnfH family protein [Fulvimonas sp. R45]
MAECIMVEVACALPDRQKTYRVELAAGATAWQAVVAAGVAQDWPDLSIDPVQLGVFGRQVAADHVLHDGDRVEVYRPLALDPKEARRRRAGG